MDDMPLRNYLRGRFQGYQDELSDTDDLSTIVDSLGLFELAEFVEQTYRIRIPVAEFQPARFASIREILSFVHELKAG